MTTNVYEAHYADLSTLTVNAESMDLALTALKRIKPDKEPEQMKCIVKEVQIVEPSYQHTLKVQTEMENGETVPASCFVRPATDVELKVYSVLALYAIITDIERYSFVGWKDEEGTILSTETTYLFTMPNNDVTITAVFTAI
jgi:hypothetical protein